MFYYFHMVKMDGAMLFLPILGHLEMSDLQMLVKDAIMPIVFMQDQVNNLFSKGVGICLNTICMESSQVYIDFLCTCLIKIWYTSLQMMILMKFWTEMHQEKLP